MSFILSRIGSLFIPSAHATDPCTYVAGGCGTGAVVGWVNGLVSGVGQLMAAIAGGASVLFILIGGFQMMTAFGDEGNFQKGYKNIFGAMIGFGVVLGSQVLVSFVDFYAGPVTSASGLSGIGLTIIQQVITALLVLFNTIFVLIIMAAGMRMLIARGKSDEFDTAKKSLGWALAGALTINAAHALARIALNIFG